MKKITDLIPAMHYTAEEVEQTLTNNVYLDMQGAFSDMIPTQLKKQVTEGKRIPSRNPAAGSLLEMSLFMKKRCNAACPECYCAGASNKDELNLSQKEDLVKQANEAGAKIVYTAGAGEPMIDPDFFPLANYINSLGMKWIVYTNGITLCNDRQARTFSGMTPTQIAERAVAIPGLTLIHKLWGSNAQINNTLTGTSTGYSYEPVKILNAHNQTTELEVPTGIRLLQTVGMPIKRMALETLCTAKTFEDVTQNIVPFAEQKGFSLVVDPILMIGGAKDISGLAISQAQYEKIEPHLADFGPRNIYGVVLDNRGYVHTSIANIDLVNPRKAWCLVDSSGKTKNMQELLHSDGELIAARYTRL